MAWEICLPYLDDVAVWASGDTEEAAFEQAMERLDMVLERFEWAGLTTAPTRSPIAIAQEVAAFANDREAAHPAS